MQKETEMNERRPPMPEEAMPVDTDDRAKASSSGPCNAMGMGMGRQSAKTLISQHIRNLRRRADELEALLGALPRDLPPMADAGLCEVFLSAQR